MATPLSSVNLLISVFSQLSQDASRIFAMKVLKKSTIAAKGQTEHTRSERSILCEIRHPYIVRLRYAFQSDVKLYLVTDYYNGGSLFYHLRKSRGFSEIRARFYAVSQMSRKPVSFSDNIRLNFCWRWTICTILELFTGTSSWKIFSWTTLATSP